AAKPDADPVYGLSGLTGLGGGFDNAGTWFGIEYEQLERIEARLGEAGDTVAINATPAGTDLKLILGGGNDSVTLNQLNADTEILGGAGDDTLTANGTVVEQAALGTKLSFDGDANLRETLVQQVLSSDPNKRAAQQDLLDQAPYVFADTISGTTANTNARSWPNSIGLGASDLPPGASALDYALERREPAAFTLAPGESVEVAPGQTVTNTTSDTQVWFRTVKLDANGALVKDAVQARGVQELGVQRRGVQGKDADGNLLYLDTNGKVVTNDTGVIYYVTDAANGTPLYWDGNAHQTATDTGIPVYVTDMANGVPLYLRSLSNGTVVTTADPFLALSAELSANPLLLQGTSGKIALTSYAGGYLTQSRDSVNHIVSGATSIGADQTLVIEWLGNGQVALKTPLGYISAQGAGGGEVQANRSAIDLWERFEILDLGNGDIALRAGDGIHYLSVDASGRLNAGGGAPVFHQVFHVTDAAGPAQGSDRIGLVGETIGEYGTVTGLDHNAQTVTLEHWYANPVVVASPVSLNGTDPVAVRISDISTSIDQATGNLATTFKIQLQEPSGFDNTHATETLRFLVVEAGRHVLADGTVIEAGTVAADRTSKQTLRGPIQIPFQGSLDASAMVFSQLQTFNDASTDGRYDYAWSTAVATNGSVQVGELRAYGGVFELGDSVHRNGSSVALTNGVQLTDAVTSQSGSFWSASALGFRADLSFNAWAEVDIYHPTGGGGDGLTFMLQPSGSTVLGTGGGYLGLPDPSQYTFLAVELDSLENGSGGIYDKAGSDGITGPHVGIDTSAAGSVARAAVGAFNQSATSSPHYLWVDYDGVSNLMQVYFSSSATKPANPTVSAVVNLETLFGSKTQLYAGFTAGTGADTNVHRVLNWRVEPALMGETIGWIAVDRASTGSADHTALASGARSITYSSPENESGGLPSFLATLYGSGPAAPDAMRLTDNGLGKFTLTSESHTGGLGQISGTLDVWMLPGTSGTLGGVPLKSFVPAPDPASNGGELLWLDDAGNRIDFQPPLGYAVGLQNSAPASAPQVSLAPVPALIDVYRIEPAPLKLAVLIAETSSGNDRFVLTGGTTVDSHLVLDGNDSQITSTDATAPTGIALSLSGVEDMDLTLAGGNDTVQVLSTVAGSSTRIDTGGGDDRIVLGDSVRGLDALPGPIVLEAGAGSNMLSVDDSGSTTGDTNVVITGSAISGLAPST
ncbi:MAG: hypothetical protein KDI64_20655, partial [Candidatus Accumulibacter sp.]|nr:hypothetical protein [Accumulibacter sp.]